MSLNKNKLSIIKLSICMITIVTVVLIILTLYQLPKDSSISGVYVGLAAFSLSVVIALATYISSEPKSSALIKHNFFGEHFVDRTGEASKLFNLLKEENQIIYISGNYGMGKTFFAKMMCDRINYFEKKRWKKYVAFYYTYEKKQKIETSIANYFCNSDKATILDVNNRISMEAKRKKRILFIDNVSGIEIDDVQEFSKALIKCNEKLNRIVVIVDGNDREDISPRGFGEVEIKLLAQSFGTSLSDTDVEKISELSDGYPVYARINIEAYMRGEKPEDCENMQNYLNKILSQLSLLEEEIFLLVVCLSLISKKDVGMEQVMAIDNRTTKKVLNKLKTYSLIDMSKECISMNRLIALISMECLSEYRNQTYQKIYTHYKSINKDGGIALIAILKSNCSFDSKSVITILHEQCKQNNFYTLIDIGELELSGHINPNAREDKECWKLIRYYYLKALLELGLYRKAKEAIDSYDNDENMEFGILNCDNDLDFDYNYLLADLDHLTNSFEDAIYCCEALYSRAVKKEQKEKCQYLYAHCLRHIGLSLEEAYTTFVNIVTNPNYDNSKIKLRSIYSAASIKMFEGELDYDYEEAFHKIDAIIYQDSHNEAWIPYVNRHKAIYEYKIKKNYTMAESILEKTLSQLEVTSLRIKYDILFELGELHRIMKTNEFNYKKSKEYYEQALDFASRVNDYNLESNCLMGLMLLNLKVSNEVNEDDIFPIIKKTDQMKLNINYNSAILLKHLIRKEKVSEDLKLHWKVMKYSDLLTCASQENKSEQLNFKLTVM